MTWWLLVARWLFALHTRQCSPTRAPLSCAPPPPKGVAPSSVAALAVDTTCCTVVALDEAGQPLRPAILWQDMRAAEQAAKVAGGGGGSELQSGPARALRAASARQRARTPPTSAIPWPHSPRQVAATGDPALRVNCGGAGPVSAEWMVPKALWLKEREPGTFERANYICEFQVSAGRAPPAPRQALAQGQL